MKKLTKGALSMVLAGSVTFSVTNALLGDPSSKRVVEENAFTNSGDQKEVDEFKRKTVKDQSPTQNLRDEQTEPTQNNPPIQVAFNNNNESDVAIAASPPNSTQIAADTTINPANVNTATTTKPNTPTTPENNITPPPVTTAPDTSGTNTPNAPTTHTNNGQEVSQAAKEKAEGRQGNKENNGKKM